jgi:repressor LexA
MTSNNLTKKQAEILRFIVNYVGQEGCPPSYREIAAGLGVSSPSTICEHVRNLERKGYLSAEGGPRSLEVETSPFSTAPPSVRLPLKGLITAGEPIEAVEGYETFEVPASLTRRPEKCYALRVKGNSMVDDGILSGDVVVIEENPAPENGAIVVALIDREFATLKRWYREDGRVRLQPANRTMQPIYVDDVAVQGVVRGLFRDFRGVA